MELVHEIYSESKIKELNSCNDGYEYEAVTIDEALKHFEQQDIDTLFYEISPQLLAEKLSKVAGGVAVSWYGVYSDKKYCYDSVKHLTDQIKPKYVLRKIEEE